MGYLETQLANIDECMDEIKQIIEEEYFFDHTTKEEIRDILIKIQKATSNIHNILNSFSRSLKVIQDY